MTVAELIHDLEKYDKTLEVYTKKNEILGTVGEVWSTKVDTAARFGVDFPCILITDEYSEVDEDA